MDLSRIEETKDLIRLLDDRKYELGRLYKAYNDEQSIIIESYSIHNCIVYESLKDTILLLLIKQKKEEIEEIENKLKEI